MKNMLKTSAFALVLFISTSSGGNADSDFGKKLWALNWTVGPNTIPTVGSADIYLPEKFNFLDGSETKKLDELLQNPSGSTLINTIVPDSFEWQAYLSYDDLGFVKDDETIDANAILQSIKQATEQANIFRKQKGWDTMEIVGWRYPPHYDDRTHRLVWAVEGRTGKDSVINYTEKILGRRGVSTALLVAAPEKLDVTVKDFEAIIDGYHFRPGESYSEFKTGDKVAEIGLTALIVGGAAAAVVKTGMGKGLIKVIGLAALAGFGAIATFIKRLFGRK
jgi:uncharacterized membrane-anchored protein